jgi:FAD/FMN-containing dehydrogenase
MIEESLRSTTSSPFCTGDQKREKEKVMAATTFKDTPRHQQKVDTVVKPVKEHASSCRPGDFFSLKKAAVSHLVPNPSDPKHRDVKIDLVSLNEILEIDPKNKICVAEPGVTFEELVRETLKHNLVPFIVPELKTITVGGAVAGGGAESSSFRYGMFHNSCLEYELVTGTGRVITCAPDQNGEIFEMVNSSFGTLGILTRLKLKLLPAMPFVRVDYLRLTDLDSFLDAVREHSKGFDVDFMDGIFHSPREFILCLGRFVEQVPYTHRYIWEIYHQSTRKRENDYLRTYDYLFRYDRDNFWVSRNFGQENKLLRLLSLPVAPDSTRMFSLARRFPFLVASTPDVAVDAAIPVEHMRAFFDWYLEVFNHFPLWILPYRIEKMYPWVRPDYMGEMKNNLLIGCGIYGFRQDGRRNYYKALEEKVFDLKGLKVLISHNYYDESTFWKIYDRETYQKVKTTIDPQNLFRDLYQKTCCAASREASRGHVDEA